MKDGGGFMIDGLHACVVRGKAIDSVLHWLRLNMLKDGIVETVGSMKRALTRIDSLGKEYVMMELRRHTQQ